MKILVLNGPNLNMLGIREPGIYGKNTFSDLLKLLEDTAKSENLEIEQYQSNHEAKHPHRAGRGNLHPAG